MDVTVPPATTAARKDARPPTSPAASATLIDRLSPWVPTQALDAVRLALTVIAALYFAMLFQLEVPAWAGWTVLSVTVATRARSRKKCSWSIVGSLIGGLVAIVMVASFAQSTLAFDVALALWLGFAGYMASIERGLRSYGFALMGFTVPIVTLGNVDHPEAVFLTAVDRCTTIVLGIVCAHASAVLVQADVMTVRRSLADTLDAAVQACADWLGPDASPAEPAVARVLALDDAIADAFTEQPSLRTGGSAFADVPLALLRLLTVGLLKTRLEGADDARAAALLGRSYTSTLDRSHHFHAVSDMLRAGRRSDLRTASFRRLALDRDLWQATRDGARGALAISAVNAFWYVSYWPSGGAAATWAGLLSVLNASRPNPARFTLQFLLGAALAAVVGVTLHYTALGTTGGAFGKLAAVLLPLGIITALGRSDKRAVWGPGFGFLILTAIDPTNVMSYALDRTLNEVLATQFGMAVAMVALSAMPPPASEDLRRRHAMQRLAKGVRAAALLPRPLRPDPGRWLSRMFMRLRLLEKADASTRRAGEDLILVGALILALRDVEDETGREIAAAAWSGAEALDHLVSGPGLTELQRDRALALAALLGRGELARWPGLPARAAS